MKISAVVFAKNAEQTVAKAIASVQFADEVLVIDAGSSDRTKEIAKELKALVVDYPGGSDYVEPVRNFGFDQAQHEWIFVLDADEEVPATLAEELKRLAEKDVLVWEIPRKNLLFGHWVQHTGWWPDYQIRFFKKGMVSWPKEIHAQPKTKKDPRKIEAKEALALLHHNITSVSQYIQRMDHYTSLEVQTHEVTSGTSGNDALEAFFSDLFRRLFKEEGYKDRDLGIYLSLLQSFYQSLTVLKRWEAKGFPAGKGLDVGKLAQLEKDFRYWLNDYRVAHASSPLEKWYWQIKRRLKQ